MNSSTTAVTLFILAFGTCRTPPDVSQCAAGQAIVQCKYEENFTSPPCPQDDANSPWAGNCIWRETNGFSGRSGWVYPACPTSDRCVPAEEVEQLQASINDGTVYQWCHAGDQEPEVNWYQPPNAPAPQPCVNTHVTWEPQDSQGNLDL